MRELVGHAENGADIADRVAAAIGLDEGGDIRETFWAVRQLFEFLARDAPLVVVFEDIHWAESTFIDLLEYIAGFSADHPPLDSVHVPPGDPGAPPRLGNIAELIVLEPLSEPESQRLIENLLGRAELPGDVRVRITRAATGNPLFVEEMLRTLIDDGLLDRDDGNPSGHAKNCLG